MEIPEHHAPKEALTSFHFLISPTIHLHILAERGQIRDGALVQSELRPGG
jgi:hypothetical protein